MGTIWDKVIKMLAGIGGAIAGAFGGWDMLLMVLVVMMVIDYISGVVVAAMGKSDKSATGGLSSAVGFAGIAKKGLMMLVVLVGAMLDRAMGATHAVCRDAVCWFYIANEGLSFLENLNRAGVEFPELIQRVLGLKKQEAEGKTDELPAGTEE